MAELRIGISGWTYVPWRGTFYPKGLSQNKELAFASRVLNSIEINGTFYSLQRPGSFAKWYEQTPADFVFSLKGNRFITHMRRLREVEKPLANFLASGVLRLNEKLGPILWQFPPNFQFDAVLVGSFFELLPHSTKAALKVAKRHDAMVKNRAWLEIDKDRPLRHAMEIRHKSFESKEFFELLREHDVALVVAETAGKWPMIEEMTSDFVYARLHGDEQLYVSGYTDEALDTWAKKFRGWSRGRKGRDIYAYFDNDVKVRSPFDAAGLALRLGLRDKPLEPDQELDGLKHEPRLNWPGIGRKKRKS
jgi:uncharacterized protein YecE (DUF72 family)